MCTDLATVTFEHGGRRLILAERAFAGVPVIQSICIPSSVETIPERCFYHCETLSNVTFEPDCRVSVLDEAAFSGCSSLRSIFIPASVETICKECFRECRALSDVTFDDNSKLAVLEESVFSNCPSLDSVIFPSGLSRVHGIMIRNPDAPDILISIAETIASSDSPDVIIDADAKTEAWLSAQSFIVVHEGVRAVCWFAFVWQSGSRTRLSELQSPAARIVSPSRR
jgi:hypothetical protein